MLMSKNVNNDVSKDSPIRIVILNATNQKHKRKKFIVKKSSPARGFGYTVSWAFLIQVYGIFWSKFGYKVFSFS